MYYACLPMYRKWLWLEYVEAGNTQSHCGICDQEESELSTPCCLVWQQRNNLHIMIISIYLSVKALYCFHLHTQEQDRRNSVSCSGVNKVMVDLVETPSFKCNNCPLLKVELKHTYTGRTDRDLWIILFVSNLWALTWSLGEGEQSSFPWIQTSATV